MEKIINIYDEHYIILDEKRILEAWNNIRGPDENAFRQIAAQPTEEKLL
jgi:hypothetical protein